MRILNLCFIIVFFMLISCKFGTQKGIIVEEYKITDLWYKISEHAGPDGIYYKVEMYDSASFFHLLLYNETKFRFEFHGMLYNIDTLHFLLPSFGVDKNDSTIVLVQPVVPKLWVYKKEFLDSLFRETKKDLLIEVFDPELNKKWVFKNDVKTQKNKEKSWFKFVPSYLYLTD